MNKWLPAALDYIPRWIEFQMDQSELPGCVIAVAEKGKLVLEQAFGHADLDRRTVLTPRHRFRVASHSKSFTAAGVMKLRERGKLRLDDPIGQYVEGLHRDIAEVTIAQVLSHSAGLVRDGWDAGQWTDLRPFLDEQELRGDLVKAPIIAANTRFKYSNHGFGLIGMVIEAITGERYRDWIKREVVAAAGLRETEPDMPVRRGIPLARGHTAMRPLGRRVVIPGDNPTNALAAATGFVSTAADLVRFFGQLSPAASRSLLSAASRREMTRRQWQDPHASVASYYGLGVASGRTADCEWFGHGGGFQGFITRTSVLPERGLAISVLTNAIDGWAHLWWGGIMQILAAFARHGAPTARVRDWTGRWWTAWYPIDLVATGNRVLIAMPAMLNPLMDHGFERERGQDHAGQWLRAPRRGGSAQTRQVGAGRGNLARRNPLCPREQDHRRAEGPLCKAPDPAREKGSSRTSCIAGEGCRGKIFCHCAPRAAYMTEVTVTSSIDLPFRLTICGIPELDEHCAAGVTHVLSILDPGYDDPPAFAAFGPHHRLALRFHDVIDPRPDCLAPSPADVERLLAFGRELIDAPDPHLLIHCHAGVSRSTASAALILAQAWPDRPARAALDAVVAIRPRTWPNLRILEFGDALLGRDGEIVAAVAAVYRGVIERDPAFEEAMIDGGRGREVMAALGR